MTDNEFNMFVEEGIRALPQIAHERMHNVAIVIADRPTRAQRQENNLENDETLFGLYEGVPQTERGVDPPLFPDKITIFKLPILEAYTSPEDIRQCVHNTVWHEVAHHFGFDEDVLSEEERRGKML